MRTSTSGVEVSLISAGMLNLASNGPPAAEQDNLTYIAFGKPLKGIRGNIGAAKPRHVGGEDSRNVDGDVAVAHNHCALRGQVEVLICVVGMAVVSCDKGRGAVAGLQLFARNTRRCSVWGPHRVHHGVVSGNQIVMGQVGTDLDIEVQRDFASTQHYRKPILERLGLGVIGCHPVPNQATRRRDPIENIDVHVNLRLIE
jgi:hypothetical protein